MTNENSVNKLKQEEKEKLAQIEKLLPQVDQKSRKYLLDALVRKVEGQITKDALTDQVKQKILQKEWDEAVRSLEEGARRAIQMYEGVDDFIQDLYIYVQDPMVAKKEDDLGIQALNLLREADLADGPTSSRLVVFDFDIDSGAVYQPAVWDKQARHFESSDGMILDHTRSGNFQFHQVNAWAVVQFLLSLLEGPEVFGRLIPWGFPGSRLIIVPHAGLTPNAFYDRLSKSLQLYYLDDADDIRAYNCLSFDVIAHEAGHAFLDGIRPLYYEFTSLQTAAFHEFFADMTAMLGCLRNNALRRHEAKNTQGNLEAENVISNLAEEFGRRVYNQKGLRDLAASKKMSDIENTSVPHDCSLVLTGAVFELLKKIVNNYATTPLNDWWLGTERILRMALAAVDFLPPVDVQFIDYAQAMLLSFYADPAERNSPRYHDYERFIKEVFQERELDFTNLPPCPDLKFTLIDDRRLLSPEIFYHFIHQHRSALHIPPRQDFKVVDVYQAIKYDRDREKNLCQLIVQYVWSEKIPLDEDRFRLLKGNVTELMCGGTLVFTAEGKLVSWMNKPGCGFPADEKLGEARKQALLDHIAAQVEAGRIGLDQETEVQVTGPWTPSVVASMQDGTMHLEMTRPTLRTLGEGESKDLHDFTLSTRFHL